MNLVLLVLCFVHLIFCQTPPPPSPKWPSTWHSWMVTTVTKEGQSTPLYNRGQLVAFDLDTNFTCRYNQQDLVNLTSQRPLDSCDYNVGSHWYLNNTAQGFPTCGSTTKLSSPLSVIGWPDNFLKSMKYVGVTRVNQRDCDHWVALNVNVNNNNYQVDVWVEVAQPDYPCQIHVLQAGSNIHTTWAFDGFTNYIPQTALDICSTGKLACTTTNWTCVAKPDANEDLLVGALNWVCSQPNIDCSPINEGGDHYYPNTVHDHASWAFNQYYLVWKTKQGPSACNFNGLAQLVPSTSSNQKRALNGLNYQDIFPNDMVCSSP
eukprot:TRINITY_DN4445_c0_g1_i2.p1 TRINITY_DN4445_c0_g1~~TRINITY_DN4445_c0_g1_i2.p1  ORF type:complete len:319 (-),score=45.01 TRINITY_DN4445_c0_g1_i2:20-976(-)